MGFEAHTTTLQRTFRLKNNGNGRVMFKPKFYVLTQPLDRFQRCRVKSCKFVFSCAPLSPNSKMLPRFKKVTSLCFQKSNFCANRLVSLSWKPGLGAAAEAYSPNRGERCKPSSSYEYFHYQRFMEIGLRVQAGWR